MNTTSAPAMPQIDGVAHRRISVGDLDMHVAEAGSGTPVLLLHGSPLHWLEHAGVLCDLGRDHWAIAPDLRGFGWTEGPAGRLDREAQVAGVLGLLDALDIERVHLVVQDFSSFAGMQLAFDRRDRIASLVGLHMPHPWTRPSIALLPYAWRLWFQPVLAAPGLGPLAVRAGRQRTVRFMLDFDPHPVPPELAPVFLAGLRQPDRARSLSRLYRQLILPGMAALSRGPYDGRHLAVPTRILVGADDVVLKADRLGPWRGTADDLEVRVIEGAAHYLAMARPDAVAEVVRELTAAERARDAAG